MDKSTLHKGLKELNEKLPIYLAAMKNQPNNPGAYETYFKLLDKKDSILVQLKA